MEYHSNKSERMNNMKKLISLALALVMIVTCLSTLSLAADPIAKVTTGTTVTECATMDEVVSLIDPSGKSVVTFLKDVVADKGYTYPYSCTIDLNGTTYSTTKGNGASIKAVGSENTTTYVKNGTIKGYVMGIRCDDGGLNVQNVKISAQTAPAIGINTLTDKYNKDHSITGSTVVSFGWVALAFNKIDSNSKGVEQPNVSCFVENSKIISVAAAGSAPLYARKNAGNKFELGKGVELYSYKPDAAAQNCTTTGEALKAEFALSKLEIPELDVKAAGLSYWHTAEYVAPAVPETPTVPETPAAPTTPTTPTVPTTPVPDVTTPATGVSVVALGVMALVSLAGAAATKKH